MGGTRTVRRPLLVRFASVAESNGGSVNTQPLMLLTSAYSIHELSVMSCVAITFSKPGVDLVCEAEESEVAVLAVDRRVADHDHAGPLDRPALEGGDGGGSGRVAADTDTVLGHPCFVVFG